MDFDGALMDPQVKVCLDNARGNRFAQLLAYRTHPTLKFSFQLSISNSSCHSSFYRSCKWCRLRRGIVAWMYPALADKKLDRVSRVRQDAAI
jgi:hypothetical protein